MKRQRLSHFLIPVFVLLLLCGLVLGVYLRPTSARASSISCQVTYTISSQFTGGFTALMNITNTGGTAINGWTLQFAFPNGQTISSFFNGSETQSGANVTVVNLSYDATIPPNSTLKPQLGFNGTWNNIANNPPASFTLNGTVCGGGSTPTPTPTHTATPTPTPTMGVTPPPTATPTSGVTSTPTTGTGISCKVTYTITSQFAGGFVVDIIVTNTGSTAINGWTLQFAFPNGQTISSFFSGSETQNGANVTVVNLSYDATISPGKNVVPDLGFVGNWNNIANNPPAAFTLNGVLCSKG